MHCELEVSNVECCIVYLATASCVELRTRQHCAGNRETSERSTLMGKIYHFEYPYCRNTDLLLLRSLGDAEVKLRLLN
jgi:hypothetical protein